MKKVFSIISALIIISIMSFMAIAGEIKNPAITEKASPSEIIKEKQEIDFKPIIDYINEKSKKRKVHRVNGYTYENILL